MTQQEKSWVERFNAVFNADYDTPKDAAKALYGFMQEEEKAKLLEFSEELIREIGEIPFQNYADSEILKSRVITLIREKQNK